MDNKNLMIILTVVVIVEVVLAAAVAVALTKDSGFEGEEVYTLYVGLEDSITHEVYDREQATETVDKIVTKYSSGLTRYATDGAWTDDSGAIVYEPSIAYVLVGADLEMVHAICDEVKEALNQSSILITVSEEITEFY